MKGLFTKVWEGLRKTNQWCGSNQGKQKAGNQDRLGLKSEGKEPFLLLETLASFRRLPEAQLSPSNQQGKSRGRKCLL